MEKKKNWKKNGTYIYPKSEPTFVGYCKCGGSVFREDNSKYGISDTFVCVDLRGINNFHNVLFCDILKKNPRCSQAPEKVLKKDFPSPKSKRTQKNIANIPSTKTRKRPESNGNGKTNGKKKSKKKKTKKAGYNPIRIDVRKTREESKRIDREVKQGIYAGV